MFLQHTSSRQRRRVSGFRLLRNRKPTAIDLFAGCGGTSLGLQKAGFDLRAAVEIDPIAAESYRRIVGMEPIVSDIRSITGRQLLESARLLPGECFLLTACAPCQGFSSQRPPKDGVKDPRNRLIDEVVRLVVDVRPAYLMLENVPGLAHGVGEPIYRSAVTGLKKLGYVRTDERILDAADYGVPQRRERLIAVFARRDMPWVRLSAPRYIDPQATDRKARLNWRTVHRAIGGLKPLASGEVDPDDILHAASLHRPDVLKRIEAIPLDGGSRADLPDELVLECHRKHNGHRDVYGRMRWYGPAPTLTGGCNKPSKGRFIHPEQHRGITLREAALLQTFPSKANFEGSREHIAEQIGNAVPPLLVAKLALPIKRIYDLRRACRSRRIGRDRYALPQKPWSWRMRARGILDQPTVGIMNSLGNGLPPGKTKVRPRQRNTVALGLQATFLTPPNEFDEVLRLRRAESGSEHEESCRSIAC